MTSMITSLKKFRDFNVLKNIKWKEKNKNKAIINKIVQKDFNAFNGCFMPAKLNAKELKLLKKGESESIKWNRAIFKAKKEAAKKLSPSTEFKYLNLQKFEIEEWNEIFIKTGEEPTKSTPTSEFRIVKQKEPEIYDFDKELIKKSQEDSMPSSYNLK